jgi:hypothetical protein
MTYVLREQVQNRYYHKDEKIIDFDTINEARNFLNQFNQFALAMGMQAILRGGIDLGEITQVCQSTIVEDKPLNCECGFINYNDICGK